MTYKEKFQELIESTDNEPFFEVLYSFAARVLRNWEG